MTPPHIGNRPALDAVHTPSRAVAVREQRDPTAATQALRWLGPGQPMVPEWDAETAVRWAFYANVIVYRCVQILATTVASLPFLAGPHTPRRPGETAEVTESSRLFQLLGPPPGGPAPKLTARRLWAWTVAQRVVTGRHGWEIETTQPRGKGDIAALWPLVSANLDAVPSDSGSEWFRAFTYGRPDQKRTLTPAQVHYGWDPSQYNFREPESPLQAARLDISIAVMMDRYNVAFLRNDARPAAVMVVEEFAEREEYQAFVRQWNTEYGGPDNAGRMAVLETSSYGTEPSKAVFLQTLGLSQKDARFIEQHQASLERVAMVLGVPWSKLDASGRTFDNASEEDHSWWESTLLPRLADLADEVNMGLAPRLGREVGWFDTSGVRALQPPTRFVPVNPIDARDAGVISDEEARVACGVPAQRDPDHTFTEAPAALTTADLPVDMQARGNDGHDDVRPGDAGDLSRRDGAPVCGVAGVHGLDDVDVRHPDPVDPLEAARLTELRRTKAWRAHDAQARILESRWRRAWGRMFNRQADATIARLRGKRGRQQLREVRELTEIGGVFDPGFWTAEAEDLAAGLYEAVFAVGGARVAHAFGIAFDLEAPYVQQFIRARANQLAGQVTDTTYRAIQDQLAEGTMAGESIDDLAQRITHVFDVASTARAETIARTEVVSAMNGSALTVAAQLPADVAAGQEWIATRDDRTRDEHADADGQVVPVGTGFVVGGETLLYPGDPIGSPENVVNCRCTVAFLTPEEMGRSLPRVETRVASAVLALIRPGEVDELALRRALREAAA